MNHASLESTKRWQELGLFPNSEFVRIGYWCFSGFKTYEERIFKRGKEVGFSHDVIGPAPHCEEMGHYLWANCIEVTRVKLFLWNFIHHNVEADNETEARELAINWYLGQKETK